MKGREDGGLFDLLTSGLERKDNLAETCSLFESLTPKLFRRTGEEN